MTILNWILLGILGLSSCIVFGICIWIKKTAANYDGLEGVSEGKEKDNFTVDLTK